MIRRLPFFVFKREKKDLSCRPFRTWYGRSFSRPFVLLVCCMLLLVWTFDVQYFARRAVHTTCMYSNSQCICKQISCSKDSTAQYTISVSLLIVALVRPNENVRTFIGNHSTASCLTSFRSRGTGRKGRESFFEQSRFEEDYELHDVILSCSLST